MSYYVYIIQSQVDQSFYIGQTKDLVQRLKKHNHGYTFYTKKLRPWEIFAYKKVPIRAEAIRLERKLKNLKSRKRIIEFVINHRFSLDDI